MIVKLGSDDFMWFYWDNVKHVRKWVAILKGKDPQRLTISRIGSDQAESLTSLCSRLCIKHEDLKEDTRVKVICLLPDNSDTEEVIAIDFKKEAYLLTNDNKFIEVL